MVFVNQLKSTISIKKNQYDSFHINELVCLKNIVSGIYKNVNIIC